MTRRYSFLKMLLCKWPTVYWWQSAFEGTSPQEVVGSNRGRVITCVFAPSHTYLAQKITLCCVGEKTRGQVEQAKSPAQPGDFRSKPWFLLKVFDTIQKSSSSPLKNSLTKKQIPKETGKGHKKRLFYKVLFHRTQKKKFALPFFKPPRHRSRPNGWEIGRTKFVECGKIIFEK